MVVDVGGAQAHAAEPYFVAGPGHVTESVLERPADRVSALRGDLESGHPPEVHERE